MCSDREAEHQANKRMSVTHRKSPSMCDGDGFGDRPSKQHCEEWEEDVGKSWRMQKAWEIWSILYCSQERVWSVQKVGSVPSGEMGGGRRNQRGPLRAPASCCVCPWELVSELEGFLAFMLEAETSEQGPCQMRPVEKNSFLWLRFREAKSQSDVVQRPRCRPCSTDGLPRTAPMHLLLVSTNWAHAVPI